MAALTSPVSAARTSAAPEPGDSVIELWPGGAPGGDRVTVYFKELFVCLVWPTTTMCFYTPRDTLVAIAQTYLVLAVVTVPLAVVARRSRQAVLPVPLAYLVLALFQVTGILHLSLWFLCTPEGEWPSIAQYLAMLR